MAEFCKAKITWGGKEVKVYESSEPGESAELIDDTNLQRSAALKRGDRLIREITLKKSGGGVGEVVGNS